MTINFAVDYVIYPAIVGAAGLALGIVIRILRRFDFGEAKYLAWAPLLVVGLGGLGFGISESNSNEERKTRYDMVSDDKSIESSKLYVAYVESTPPKEQQRLVPRTVNGGIIGVSVAVLVMGIVSLVVWMDRYDKKENK